MKKFFPAIFISALFCSLVVFQMSLTGKSLNAAKVSDSQKKSSLYEKNYSTLKFQTSVGTKVSLSEVKQPIVILNFWASWCTPCIAEFASVKKMLKNFSKDEVLFIGVNNDDEKPSVAIKKTNNKYKLPFESVVNLKYEITEKYRLSSIPTTIVYYKGKVIHAIEKEMDFNSEDFISKLKKSLKN